MNFLTKNYWIKTRIVWPLSYRLKRLRARKPALPSNRDYSFDQAKSYWGNVPKSHGDNPLNTETLAKWKGAEILAKYEAERQIALEIPERKLGFDWIRRLLPRERAVRVMDYGSGFGFYGLEVLRIFPQATVLFCDINDTNLSLIERIGKEKKFSDRLQTIHVKTENAQDVQVAEPLDMIISMGVLHHSPHASEIVKHITQFLRPGGDFLSMLYNPEFLRALEIMTGKKLDKTGFGALTDPEVSGLWNPYSEAYTVEDACRLFSGLKLITQKKPEPPFTVYHFKKPS